DLYAVLGVSRAATSAELKRAHRAMSLRHHPDRVAEAEKGAATERMASINQAFDVLGDEAGRERYDRTGEF
ncbi:heat shock protein DnaJ, partial [Melanomma pulvis-pyrius CBS 109.77]